MKKAVLMSGGIDSSFAALYLREKGFDIIGVTFLEIGDKAEEREIIKAKKVAKTLSIPHIVLNVKRIYKREIIQPFCQALLRGETPNACPFCNRIIKFGIVLDKIKEKGIEKIATGHYAKGGYDKRNGRWFLKKAKDKKKDQSYFLWKLSQRQLSRIIFPVGNFTKKEIKARMQKKFPDLFKPQDYRESQDICFLRELKLSEFLRKQLKEKPGSILDLKGKIIGEHSGIHFFTIGQRSGLKIGAKSPQQEPLYVIDIQKEKNAIIVGEEKHLFKEELEARDLNWVSIKPPEREIRARACIRYRHREVGVKIHLLLQNKARVTFKEKQKAITPGQHVVFYIKDLLLGGGIIKK
jgi:tRNA-specific 2-thiouridylase